MTDNAMFALIDSLQRKCAATELHICKPQIAVLNTVYSIQLDKLQSSQYFVVTTNVSWKIQSSPWLIGYNGNARLRWGSPVFDDETQN